MEGFNIDTLSIKMVGDPTGYQQSLRQADTETKRAAEALRVSMGTAITDVGNKVASTGSKLKDASNAAKAYGDTIAKSLSSGVATSSREASSAVGGLASQLTGFTDALIGIPFGYIATGIGMMVAGFIRGVQEIEQLDLKARRLGVSITELRTAMTWSGAASTSVSQAIGNVNRTIAQSQIGLTNPTRDLQSLASVSGAGMKAESFNDVVRQLSSIRDETTRAAFAFRLLGDNASDFLDVLSKPGAMREAEGMVKRFGLGVSEADLANAKAISQTIRELTAVWNGFVNQLVLGVAPFARVLSEAFDPNNVDLTWIKDTIFQIGRGILLFGAYAVEASRSSALLWEGIHVGLKVVTAGFLQLKAVAIDTIREIAQAALAAATGPVKGLFETIGGGIGGERGRAMGKAAGILADMKLTPDFKELGESAERARKESSDMMKKAGQEFADILAKLPKTDAGKWVDMVTDKIKKFSDEGVRGIERMSNRQSLLIKTAEGEISSMRKGLQTPGQSFIQDMRKIFSLQGARNFDLTGAGDKGFLEGTGVLRTPFGIEKIVGRLLPDMFKGQPGLEDRIAFNSFQRLIQQSQIPFVPQLPSAAQFRSQEAVSAELKFEMQGQRPEIQEQIRQALELANQQRASQIILGNQVITALNRLSSLLKDQKEIE